MKNHANIGWIHDVQRTSVKKFVKLLYILLLIKWIVSLKKISGNTYLKPFPTDESKEALTNMIKCALKSEIYLGK